MKSLIALALLAASSTAIAQNYNQQSQPVTHTYTVSGRIIAIDRPITRTIQRGQTCDQYQQDYNQGYSNQQYQENSDLNAGSVVGAIVGGALGSRVGKGSGRDVAIGVGAATGAIMGNSNSRSNVNSNYRPLQNYQQRCTPIFEEVVVGYSFIAQYEHYQIRGQMRSLPQIGQLVDITIRSTLYIENRGL